MRSATSRPTQWCCQLHGTPVTCDYADRRPTSLRLRWGKEIFNYLFYKLPLRSLPRFKTAFLFLTGGIGGERVYTSRKTDRKQKK